MNSNIEERVLMFAYHILETKDTVRTVADKYGISKSTVHYDVSKRLRKINKKLYLKIKKILENNFQEKHIRGGESTKKKYILKSLKNQKTNTEKYYKR